MKKLLLLSAFAFVSYSSEAKLALSLEAGAGFGSTGSRFEVDNSFYIGQTIINPKRTVRPAFGATISYSKNRMFFGVGVRYWSAASEYDLSVASLATGQPVVVKDLTNTVNSVSIPIHAGFHFPIKKIFIEAKVKAGPSIVSQELSAEYAGDKRNTSNIDNSILFVGGTDLGIGTRISPRTQLQLKYSFMSYLADVKYDPIPTSFMPYMGAIRSGKPNMHTIMLEASLRL